MPNRPAKFSDKEKGIFLDVIEQYNKDLLSTYTNSDKARSTWNEITRDYNSVAKRMRPSNHLRNLWTLTKERFYKEIVDHGIKVIFDFSHQELRALNLIPSNYFSNLCKTMEFERCLKTASSLARQIAIASEAYDDSKYTVVVEDDGQYACGSDQLSDNSQSNVGFSRSEAMEDETVDPLSLTCSQDSQSLDSEQECLESNTFVKEETVMDLDDNLINENSPVNPATSNERCRSKVFVKLEVQKFVPTLEPSDKPLRVVDSFYGSFPNKVISENASELENLLHRPPFASPSSESTSPFIVNVQSLTSEQFNESEQAIDNRTEHDIATPTNFDAVTPAANFDAVTPVNFDAASPVNFDAITPVNFNIVSPVSVSCDLLLNRTAKTTPNFPNAIFEFEEESENSMSASVMPPAMHNVAPVVMPPAMHNAASLVVPQAIRSVAQNNVLNDTKFTQSCLEDEEQILFECEMDKLRKERELINKRHKSKMKSLRYELNALDAHLRDMIQASQLRENQTVLDGSKGILDEKLLKLYWNN